ncbi:MAG: MIP/aquaporin family protein [Acidimicrobiales bacterium]
MAPWLEHFEDVQYEWRRLFAEFFGTFLLVLAAAGPAVVAVKTHQSLGRGAAVTAPGLTVLAVILFMGKVSGAHLNPAVTLAFVLRREFPWRRVPLYMVTQCIGAAAASVFLLATFGNLGHLGVTEVGPGINGLQAVSIEAVLTLGLVSTILGTASGAQNVGSLSAVGVGAYIVLAGLWSSPATGASMNPARSLGPALVGGHYANLWIYIVGPLAGALLAVGAAMVLRGPGGDPAARRAAGG